MLRPSRIGIPSPPTVLQHWSLRCVALRYVNNSIPEKGENKILPGWISVSGCDSKDSSAAFGVEMTRSGRSVSSHRQL